MLVHLIEQPNESNGFRFIDTHGFKQPRTGVQGSRGLPPAAVKQTVRANSSYAESHGFG